MLPDSPSHDLLLDYLYGLLDEPALSELTALLETSPEWQQALAATKQKQQLLAAAAKGSFTDVRFRAPGALPQAEPVSLPMRMPQPARRTWHRYAVAACLLIAAAGTLAGVSWYGRYSQMVEARERAQKLQAEHAALAKKDEQVLETKHAEIRAIQEQIKLIETKWESETTRVKKDLDNKQMQVIVTGPRNLQAGAKNDYLIETLKPPHGPEGNLRGAPVPSKIKASVIDAQSRRVLYETNLSNLNGQCQLALPRDLPVKPGAQLNLEVVATSDAGVQAAVTEQVPLIATLYMSHLWIDRPMYKPGDTVRYRALTLERFSMKPAREIFNVQFQLTAPSGAVVFTQQGNTQVVLEKNGVKETVKGPDGLPLTGIAAGEFVIPADLLGGEYTLTYSDPENRFPVEARKFIINKYQAPRLNKELEFTRKTYGPGATVEVLAKVAKVEGGKPLVEQPVTVTAQVDGTDIAIDTKNIHTDKDGQVPPIRFTLPAKIERGAASVSLQFTDGANHETLVRPIPIVLKRLNVDFYPEGGDLVADVANRVYFQVRTTLDKPAELQGKIVDDKGNVVAQVQTLNDDKEAGVNHGLGAFTFTPKLGVRYELKIDAPVGIISEHLLPAVRGDGVVLHLPEGVVTDKVPVVVTSAKSARTLLVGTYCRGRLLDSVKVEAKAGEATKLTLKASAGVSGVHRITVFEEKKLGEQLQLVPVAERLIYRRPVEALHFTVTPDKKSYAPGDRVKLTLDTTTEQQASAAAVMLVAVVDESIFKLADDKTLRNMPTHFFLGSEIRKPQELEYADFLVSTHPRAPQALDLLLGTQGWRRFAEQQKPAEFKAEQQNDDAERLLTVNGNSEAQVHNAVQLAQDALDKQYAPQWEQKQQVLSTVEKQIETAAAAKQGAQAQRYTESRQVQQQEEQAATQMEQFWAAVLLGAGVLVLVLLFGGGLVSMILAAASRPAERGSKLAFGVFAIAVGFVAVISMLTVTGGRQNATFNVVGHELGRAQQEAARETAKATGAPVGAMFGAPDADVFARAATQKRGGVGQEWREGQPPPPMGTGIPIEKKHIDEVIAQLKTAKKVAVLTDGVEGKDDKHVAPDFTKGDKGEKVLAADPKNEEKQKYEPGININLNQQQQQFQGQHQHQGLLRLENGKDKGKRPVGAPQAPQVGFGEKKPDVPGRDFEQLQRDQKELRKLGLYQELANDRFGRPISGLQTYTEPYVVREYAHVRPPSKDEVRRDFTETLFWQPALVTIDGKAQVAFELSDAVTTFQVTVWGHGVDGRLGATTHLVSSRLPFSVEPKVPVEVTHSDKLTIPVTIANDTSKKRDVMVSAQAANLDIIGDPAQTLSIAGDQRRRHLFHFKPTVTSGDATVRFTGQSPGLGGDSVERSFKIVPEGFPFVGSKSDLLEEQAVATVKLPESGWVQGSLKLQVQVYPSTLADLQKGLEGLLREPYGCFEQTSSSNYPNIMILSYLKESEQARPELEQRARSLLGNGYQKLLSFECVDPRDGSKKEGYEWFGQTAPPHEALTAYGLLQFRDMAKIAKVDEAMLARTVKYLLGQRDGNGGFKRNSRSLDRFGGAPALLTNAYIIWALTEIGGEDNLQKELAYLTREAATSQDPYFLALAANSFLNAGKPDDAVALLKRLAARQSKEGHVPGAETSITRSGGRDLEIETTALALLGWLKANRPADFQSNIQKAVAWIGQQRGGYGGFGSTQSTILALKALVAHAKNSKATASDGELRLYVNGSEGPVAIKRFAAGSQEPLIVTLPEEKFLKADDNKVRVEMTGKNAFPYTLTWSYNTLKPDNAPTCPVKLSTKLSKKDAKEGDTVRLTATIDNTTQQQTGMAMAIIGLPSGLTIPEDMKQLKELIAPRENGTEPGVVSFFEIRGRELILYWRAMQPKERITVDLDLICRIPGEFRGPASRAYLYYSSDLKYWADPLPIRISPQVGQ